VLGVRPGRGNNLRGRDVLIQWKGLLSLEATWEPYNMIQQQFLTFTLRARQNFRRGMMIGCWCIVPTRDTTSIKGRIVIWHMLV